jgi:hypothetical protein
MNDMSWGPFFGYGELKVGGGAFNELNNCISKCGKSFYGIPINEYGINMLTNLKCKSGTSICEFSITELEVWGVKFKEK